MTGIFKRKARTTSAFSEFFRSASARDKKRVYSVVLERASERQRAVVERASKDRIDLSDPEELRQWSKALGVSEEQLKRTVHDVGNKPREVRDALSKRVSG